MHLCIYCKCKFNSRPQVKNPKACLKPACQKKRQRDNERLWHENQRHKFDKKYHNKRRKERKSALSGMLDKIVSAIKIGFTFTAQGFDTDLFQVMLGKFLSAMGLRRANKLWSDVNT